MCVFFNASNIAVHVSGIMVHMDAGDTLYKYERLLYDWPVEEKKSVFFEDTWSYWSESGKYMKTAYEYTPVVVNVRVNSYPFVRRLHLK